MTYEFADIPLIAVSEKPKIRFKKLAKDNSERKSSIPKSLEAFSKAQKAYAEERKVHNRKQKKLEAREKYLTSKKLKKQKGK